MHAASRAGPVHFVDASARPSTLALPLGGIIVIILAPLEP
jgi:hypothetical protein